MLSINCPNLSDSFLGQLNGSEVDHKGTISIPNLSDENTADEIDVSVFKSLLFRMNTVCYRFFFTLLGFLTLFFS